MAFRTIVLENLPRCAAKRPPPLRALCPYSRITHATRQADFLATYSFTSPVPLGQGGTLRAPKARELSVACDRPDSRSALRASPRPPTKRLAIHNSSNPAVCRRREWRRRLALFKTFLMLPWGPRVRAPSRRHRGLSSSFFFHPYVSIPSITRKLENSHSNSERLFLFTKFTIISRPISFNDTLIVSFLIYLLGEGK